MPTDPSWIDADLPGRLAIMPRPRAGDWLESEIESLRACGVDVLVSLLVAEEVEELELSEEEAFCAAVSIAFLRFPIADRGMPDASALRVFVRPILLDLQDGKSVVIHCRAGIGRSTLVATAILIESGMNAEEALDRIAQARRLRVPDTDDQRDWIVAFAQE